MPPTRLNCRVESRWRRRCVQNSQLAHDDCRRIRSTIWKLNLAVWLSKTLIDIDNFFSNDVIMLSLVTNLNNSTAQEIVNWVTTGDGCVHTADASTRLNWSLDSWVASAVCIGLYGEHETTRWAPSWTNSSVWSYRSHWILEIRLRNRCSRSWYISHLLSKRLLWAAFTAIKAVYESFTMYSIQLSRLQTSTELRCSASVLGEASPGAHVRGGHCGILSYRNVCNLMLSLYTVSGKKETNSILGITSSKSNTGRTAEFGVLWVHRV